VSAASSDDATVRTRIVGEGRNRFVGSEVQVALERKAEFAAHGAGLREADAAEFGAT
jgi:hypothetical protein